MSPHTDSSLPRVFTDPRCLDHISPAGFPEKPDRLIAILDHLRSVGFEVVEPGPHTDTRQRVADTHDARYLERFRRAVERGDGLLDSADNPLCPATWEAASAAVDAALGAADWMMAAPGRQAHAAVRPPGHHAEHAQAMGFCYFNTAAVVAEHLRRAHGVERLAIYDFDVHHGNGTQHLFEERADVVYLSTHQFPFYPGTGAAEERGRGAGRGATVNVPMDAGAGDDDYAHALDDHILPALEAARPQVLVVSAGFDCWRGDPLGGMGVTLEGHRDWGRRLGALAARVCGGRLLSLLEGGYDVASLGPLTESWLRGVAEGVAGGETSEIIGV